MEILCDFDAGKVDNSGFSNLWIRFPLAVANVDWVSRPSACMRAMRTWVKSVCNQRTIQQHELHSQVISSLVHVDVVDSPPVASFFQALVLDSGSLICGRKLDHVVDFWAVQ